MYDSDSKGTSYTAGFFMLILFGIAGLILGSILSIPVWRAMTGRSILEMEKYMTDPANANAMRLIQCISQIVGFLVPTIFTAYLLNRKPIKLIGFKGPVTIRQAAIVLGIIITAMMVSGALSYFTELIPISSSWRTRFDNMEQDFMKQVEAIVGLNNFGQYLLSVFIMAFIPALCEEAVFRGGLQNFLTRGTRKPWMAIIIVSILFSAAHFSFYGFLSRFFLGVVLGLIYYYSGRLWLCILAHFINNALGITLLYLYKNQGKLIEESMSDTSGGYWGLLALPVLILLFKYFKKASPQPIAEPADPKREELRNTPFY